MRSRSSRSSASRRRRLLAVSERGEGRGSGVGGKTLAPRPTPHAPLLILAILAACHRPPPPLSEAELRDAEKLWSALERRSELRRELRGAGKARLTPAGQKTLSVAVNVAARRPADLRFEALSFFGEPVAVLAAAGGRFALYDVRGPAFFRGTASAENLARLLPVPLEPDALVALLLGGAPELPAGAPREVAEKGDAVELRLSVLPHALATVASLEERVTVARDLSVLAVERRATGPAAETQWRAEFADFVEAPGFAQPSTIRLVAPAAGASMELSLSTVEPDPRSPLPQGAFALGAPAGVPVTDLP